MAWQKGPLPPDTYHWGGVVPVGEDSPYGYFYFADFCGDYVKTCPEGRILKPEEVALFNNCLELPEHARGRAE